MIIKRSIRKDGNILPEAYNLLNNLPEKALNYLEHNELHPVDIYSSSLGRIIKSFLRLKENLIILNDSQEDPIKHRDNVLESQKEVLQSIHAHIDDCNRILKVTSPVMDFKNLNRNDKKKADRHVTFWLQKAKHPSYNYFEEKIRPYRTVGKIVNKIKHENAKLRLLSIEGSNKSFGYYVEGKIIKKNEVVLCPDTEIHPECTAFSFYRDMALNFYIIYIISHYLSLSLSKSLKNYYDITISQKASENIYFSELKEISEYIQDNEFNYFPDEYNKQLPLILFDNSHDNNLIMNLDENFIINPNSSSLTVFFYQEGYAHVSQVIRPYVEYIHNRYHITDFKVINFENSD